MDWGTQSRPAQNVGYARGCRGRVKLKLVGMLLQWVGLALFLFASWLIFQKATEARNADRTQRQAVVLARTIGDQLGAMRALLRQDIVQSLAREQIAQGSNDASAIEARLKQQSEAVLGAELINLAPHEFDPQTRPGGYMLLDLIVVASVNDESKLQYMGAADDGAHFAGAIRVSDESESPAFLVVTFAGDSVVSLFSPFLDNARFIALQHSAGPRDFFTLKQFGNASAPSGWLGAHRESVEHSSLYISVPDDLTEFSITRHQSMLLLLVLGALCFAIGMIWQRRARANSDLSNSPLTAPIGEFDTDPTPTKGLQQDADSQVATAEIEGPADGPESDSLAESNETFLLEQDGGEEDAELPSPFAFEESADNETNMKSKEEVAAEIFRAYDIRGVLGKTLDEDTAYYIGRAIGTEARQLSATPVAVARDGRLSGPGLVQALVRGLNDSGADVVNAGAVPTGVLYYATHEVGSGTGVMVTGSHNPPDYNGFKIMIGGDTLSGERITALYDRIQAGDFSEGQGNTLERDFLPSYVDTIAGDIKLKRPLKVVADCGNGIGGIIAADVLRAIGAEVIPLFEEVDGTFPNHHPDPSEPENLEDLIKSVMGLEADLGVAFDGDADRLGVVTAEGENVFADRIMMLFSEDILKRNPGSKIIYDVKCTGHLARVIAEAGGEPIMWKTGHSFMKRKLKEEGAPFAGEMSGHFFFKERWFGFDDGIYSAARLLEILAASDASPTDTLKALPRSHSTPELKVQMKEGETYPFIDAFIKEAKFEGAIINTIDGLRADFLDGWGLVRSSNTTPVLVCRFDADSDEALQRIMEEFRTQMRAVRVDLNLPF